MTTNSRPLATAILAVLLLAVGALVFRGSDDGDSATAHPSDAAPQTVGGAENAAPATDPVARSAAAESAAGLAIVGTYRYRVERRQPGAQLEVYESTLVVTGTGGKRSEERDHLGTRVRRNFALHDADRTETAMILFNGDYEGRCDWAPGLLSSRTPLEAGRTWKAGGSCRLPVVNGTVDVTTHEDARVAAIETITVTGTSLETVRIERFTKVTSKVDSKRTRRNTQRTEWFSPTHGLVVRSVDRVTESGDGPDQVYELTEELLGLAPT